MNQELPDAGAMPHLARPETAMTPQQVGLVAFLVTETAFFGTLIMAYVYFLRQVVDSVPGPNDVFNLPLAIGATFCLLSSSVTIHLADKSLQGNRPTHFLGWWALTIALGAAFLAATALEWHSLIVDHRLTISRNMFGSTYFTLVGFHALHVSIGVLVMSIMLVLAWRGQITVKNHAGAQLTSWYWHFVDGVWVVVFTLVYIAGR